MNKDTPVTSAEFTYTQAKLMISTPEAYDRRRVRRAACWMLGCLTASREDIDQAAYAASS